MVKWELAIIDDAGVEDVVVGGTCYCSWFSAFLSCSCSGNVPDGIVRRPLPCLNNICFYLSIE